MSQRLHSPYKQCLNNVLRIVTKCLLPTLTNYLFIRSGIELVKLRWLDATLSLAYCGSLDANRMLHGLTNGSSDARQERLRSRFPFVPAAQKLLNNLVGLDIRVT